MFAGVNGQPSANVNRERKGQRKKRRKRKNASVISAFEEYII